MNMIMADQEFKKLEESLGKLVQFNTAAAREHVGEIKRSNRTTQERARAVSSVFPYVFLPKQVVGHLVYYVTTMLNCCINKQGISNYLSPREIVLRRRLD